MSSADADPDVALHLADLTHREATVLAEAGAVAFLPAGATEAHGPHLPLGTDVVISLRAAELAAQALRAEGQPAIVLPPLAYAVTEFASGFGGTISLPPETAAALVRDVILGAKRAGFPATVIANAHLEPAHLATLRAGMAQAVDGGARVAFPDVTRKPHALRLGEEFKSGACHAGSYETSLVLAARPELVRTDEAAALPDNPISLSRAIRDGKKTFVEAGGPDAYFGWPSQATEAQGHALYRSLAAIFADAARALL